MSTSELTTEQVAEYLAATSELIDGELEALGDDSAWHFDPKEWCANQVVGHLVEAEKRGFAGRIREILASKEKTSAWDQAAVARDEAQRAGEPPRVLAGRAGHQCGPMRGAERDGRGGHDDDDERDLTPWVTPSVHGATVDLLP